MRWLAFFSSRVAALARYPVCCRLNLNSARTSGREKQVMLPQAPPDNKDIISGIDPSRSLGRPVEADESICCKSASRQIRRSGSTTSVVGFGELRFRCARRAGRRRSKGRRRNGSRVSRAGSCQQLLGPARVLLMIRCCRRADVCFGRIAGKTITSMTLGLSSDDRPANSCGRLPARSGSIGRRQAGRRRGVDRRRRQPP